MADYDEFDDFLEDYEEDDDEAQDDADSEKEEEKDEEVEEELSEDEQVKRVEAFQKLQKRNMLMAVKPKKFKPEQRKDAIRWLGEAGDPTSIPALIKVYRKDKTPGMKAESAYALGQLRAMGDALDDPEMEEQAYDLLNKIVLHQKFGKRVNESMFKLIEMGLGASAAVLFIIGMIAMFLVGIPAAEEAAIVEEISVQETLTAAPSPTSDSELVVQDQLQDYYAQLNHDTNFFQFEMLTAGRGGSITCEDLSPDDDIPLYYSHPSYNLSSNWIDNPRFTPIANKLNEVRDLFEPARQAHANSCSNGQVIVGQEALDLGTNVLNAQAILREASELLSGAGLEVPTAQFASPTPVPTNTPQATATFDLNSANVYIGEIERLITDMTGPRGTTTALVFNWQQVIDSGQMYREGCNAGAPFIPDDYALPAELVGSFTQLDTAVENVNIALLTTRQASSAFYTACSSGEVPEDAANRLAQASLALNAFAAAQAELINIRGN